MGTRIVDVGLLVGVDPSVLAVPQFGEFADGSRQSEGGLG